jgi:Icc-related predicted phosphoesterase
LRVLYTSDIHASHSHLFSMLSVAEREEVDCLIIGGDVVPHYLPERARYGQIEAQALYLENTFIPELTDFKDRTDAKIYFDLGNDDLISGRKVLEKCDGELFDLIHFTRHPLTDKVDIVGYMIVPPTPFTIKDLEKSDSTESPCVQGNRISVQGYISANGILEDTVLDLSTKDTIESDLHELSKGIDRPFIFVSHSPPFNTPLDVIYNGNHVGSMSVRRFIEKWAEKGLLIAAFHGHIHESPDRSGSIQTTIGNVLCFNPGQGNGEGAKFRYLIFELSGTRIFPDL